MPAEVVRVGAQHRLVLRAGRVACVPDALRGEYSLGDRVRCVVDRHASPVVWVPMDALNRLRHVFSRRRGLYG